MKNYFVPVLRELEFKNTVYSDKEIRKIKLPRKLKLWSENDERIVGFANHFELFSGIVFCDISFDSECLGFNVCPKLSILPKKTFFGFITKKEIATEIVFLSLCITKRPIDSLSDNKLL